MAQVLSRIAAAAQAWQQGSGQQPAGKAQASAGNPQASTATTPIARSNQRDIPVVYDDSGNLVSVGGFPAPPPGYTPGAENTTVDFGKNPSVVTTPGNVYELSSDQLQNYYNSTPLTRGGITKTIAEWQQTSNDIYDALDPTPRIGDDGYTQRDFLDDVKRDNAAAEVLQAAARSNKSRRKDPQTAIAEDEAGRGRRRRTLAALGTRKSSAGSGVLGGGGQPGQAVRPGRTSAASVLG